MSELVITHNSGFFSCCSVRLYEIINFFNKKKRLPVSIDTKAQFASYKVNPYSLDEDIDAMLFSKNNYDIKFERDIDYHHNHQFLEYKDLDIENISVFVKRYFTPSEDVEQYVNHLKSKYNIDYSNTAAVYYRGNDKCTETGIAPYTSFFDKCAEILAKDPQLVFLVQTDELEFREEFIKLFPNSIFIEEMPVIKKNINHAVHFLIHPLSRPKFALRFFSATVIVSRCKYVITHTGNCGIWSVLLRGNTTNVHQYIQHPNSKWL